MTAEREIEADASVAWRFDEVESLLDLEPEAASMPEGTRLAMGVEHSSLHAAGWVPSTGQPPGSGPAIILKGPDTPTAQIVRGYLYFVDPAIPGALRRPHWDAKNRWLRIWMDYRALPQVLQQLDKPVRQLWIGWFKNGHVYAEFYGHD